jgi:hypothetical protein
MSHVTPSELVVSWGWKVLDRDDDDNNDGEEVVVQRTRSIASSSSLLLLARAAAESNEDEDEIECRLTQLLSSLSHLSFNESSPPPSRGITTATIAYNATSPPPSALLLMVDWIWNCFMINGNCNSKSNTDNHHHQQQQQQQHLASSLSSFIYHKEWMIAIEAMSLLLFSIVPHSSSSASSCTTTTTGTTAATATTTTWSTMDTPIHQHCLTISSWRLHAIVLDAWIAWDSNNRSNNLTNNNNHLMVDNVTHKLMLAHFYLLLMNLSMKQHGNNSLSLLSPPPSSVSPSSSSSSSSYVFRPRRWQSIVCHTIRCYQQLCSYYQQQQQQQHMNKTMNEKKDREIDSDDDVDDDSHELSLTSIIVLSQLSILRLWSHYLLPTCFHLLHQLHHVHHHQSQQQQHNTKSMSASISLSPSSSSSSSFDHLWWWNHVMGIQTVALLATTTQLIQYVSCHWECRQYWKMWNHHYHPHPHQDNHDHDKKDRVAGDNHHPLRSHDDIPYHHPQVHQSTFTNLSSYCTHHLHESVDHIIMLHFNSRSSNSSTCCCSCCAYHPSTDDTWEEQLSHYQNHHYIGDMDVLLLLCNTPRRFTQWNHIYLLYSQYTQSHHEPQSFVSLSSLPSSSSFSSSSVSLIACYINDQHINNTMMHPCEAAVAWWTSGTLREIKHALQYNGYGDDYDDDDEVDDPSSNEIHTMDQGNVEQPSHDQQQMMKTLRHRLDFVCELSTRWDTLGSSILVAIIWTSLSSPSSSLSSPVLSRIQSLAVAKQWYLAFPHVTQLLMPATTLMHNNHDNDNEAHVVEPETTSLDCFVALQCGFHLLSILIELTPRYTIHVPINLTINTAVDPFSLDSPVGACQVLINHIVAPAMKREKPASLTVPARRYHHSSSSSLSSSSLLFLSSDSRGYVPYGADAYRLLKKLVAVFVPSTQLLLIRVLIRDCPYSNMRSKIMDLLQDIVNWHDVSNKSAIDGDIHNVWLYLEALFAKLEHAIDAMQCSNEDGSNDHVKQQFAIMVAEDCEVYVSLFNVMRRWKLYMHTNPSIHHFPDRLHRLYFALNSLIKCEKDDNSSDAPYGSYCFGLLLLSIEALL